jgi:hypothetical protein
MMGVALKVVLRFLESVGGVFEPVATSHFRMAVRDRKRDQNGDGAGMSVGLSAGSW